jgi:hypothetical protein
LAAAATQAITSPPPGPLPEAVVSYTYAFEKGEYTSGYEGGGICWGSTIRNETTAQEGCGDTRTQVGTTTTLQSVLTCRWQFCDEPGDIGCIGVEHGTGYSFCADKTDHDWGSITEVVLPATCPTGTTEIGPRKQGTRLDRAYTFEDDFLVPVTPAIVDVAANCAVPVARCRPKGIGVAVCGFTTTPPLAVPVVGFSSPAMTNFSGSTDAGGAPSATNEGQAPSTTVGLDPTTTLPSRAFGTSSALPGSRAGVPGDYTCTERGIDDATGVAIADCRQDLAVQTTIAGGQFGLAQFEAPFDPRERAMITSPLSEPVPGKQMATLLTEPPPCGGVGDFDGEPYTADGVNLRDGSFSRRFGCLSLDGGAMPLSAGLRYETGFARNVARPEPPPSGSTTAPPPPPPMFVGYRSANLSAGWTVSYSRRIHPQKLWVAGAGFTGNSVYRVYFENHRSFDFNAQGAGPEYYPLGMTTDDASKLVVDEAADEFVLTYRGGLRDHFDRKTGVFKKEVDLWGNSIEARYALTKVGSGDALIKRLERKDPSGEVTGWIEYVHRWTTTPYDPYPEVGLKQWRLTSIVDSAQRELNIDYDAKGRVVGVRETVIEGEPPKAWTIGYSSVEGAPALVQTITSSIDGNADELTMQYVARPAPGAPAPNDDGSYGFYSVGVQSRGIRRNVNDRTENAKTLFLWGAFGAGPENEADLQVQNPEGVVTFYRHQAPVADLAANAVTTQSQNRITREYYPQVFPALAPLGVYRSAEYGDGVTPQASGGMVARGLVTKTCEVGTDPDTCSTYAYTAANEAEELKTLVASACKPFNSMNPNGEPDPDTMSCDAYLEYSPTCKLPKFIVNGSVAALGADFGRTEVAYNAQCAVEKVTLPRASSAAAAEVIETEYYDSGVEAGLPKIVTRTGAEAEPEEYAYDGLGYLQSRRQGAFVETYTRNARGHVLSETDVSGITTSRVFTRLDGLPDRVDVGPPSKRLTQRFSYDAHGFVTETITDWGTGTRRDTARWDIMNAGGDVVAYDRRLGVGTAGAAASSISRYPTSGGAVIHAETVNGKTTLHWTSHDDNGGVTIRETPPGLPQKTTAYLAPGNGESTQSPYDTPSLHKITRSKLRVDWRLMGPPGESAQLTEFNEYNAGSILPNKTIDATGCTVYTRDSARGLPTSIERQFREGEGCGATVSVTDLKYDAFGREIEKRVSAGGRSTTTTHEYDAYGRPTRSCVDGSACTEFRYEGTGTNRWAPSAKILPSGVVHAHTYDPLGRLATVQREGQTFNYTWRPDGALLMVTGAGRTTLFRYDVFGRKVFETNSDGVESNAREWEHNADGQVTKLIDFDGRATSFAYAPDTGLLDTVTHAGTVCKSVGGSATQTVAFGAACPAGTEVLSPSAGRVKYAYHPGTRLVSTIEDAVRDVCTEHDECACEIAPGAKFGLCPTRTSRTEKSWDAYGKLASRTRVSPGAGSTGGLTYTVSYPRLYSGGQQVEEQVRYWDQAGLTNEALTVRYMLDGVGRTGRMHIFGRNTGDLLVDYDERFGKTSAVGGSVFTANIDYDAQGFATQIYYPDQRVAFNYLRDPATRDVTTMSEIWSGIAYTTQYEYNALRQLRSATYPSLQDGAWEGLGPNNDTLAARTDEFTYDGVGNLTRLGNLVFGTQDNRNRIIGVPGYSYDGNGNLIGTPSSINLVSNGSFAEGLKDWVPLSSSPGSSASAVTIDGTTAVRLTAGETVGAFGVNVQQLSGRALRLGDTLFVSARMRGAVGGEQGMLVVEATSGSEQQFRCTYQRLTTSWTDVGCYMRVTSGWDGRTFKLNVRDVTPNATLYATDVKFRFVEKVALPNPSFELGLVNWTYFSTATSRLPSFVTDAATHIYDGSRALVLAHSGEAGRFTQQELIVPDPVQTGERYVFRARVRLDDSSQRIRLRVEDARNGASLGDSIATINFADWSHPSVTVNVPSSSNGAPVKLILRNETPGNASAIAVDAVTFQRVPVPPVN